jgi:hypothetical protein
MMNRTPPYLRNASIRYFAHRLAALVYGPVELVIAFGVAIRRAGLNDQIIFKFACRYSFRLGRCRQPSLSPLLGRKSTVYLLAII